MFQRLERGFAGILTEYFNSWRLVDWLSIKKAQVNNYSDYVNDAFATKYKTVVVYSKVSCIDILKGYIHSRKI